MNTQEEVLEKAKKVGSKWLRVSVAGLALILIGSGATTYVDSGEAVRIQNNFTGAHEWVLDEGYHAKLPFLSKVNVYNSVSTIGVTDDEKLISSASATRSPLPVTFADNYGGKMEASFRAKLSTSPIELEAMHQDVKSQRNLEGNTLLPFAKDMLSITTDQFLAQNFMQGGKGAFKKRLQDQSDKGMRNTTREKIRVDAQSADQSLTGSRDQANTIKQFKYQVVTERDSKGNVVRRPHSLTKYGITITQIDLGEFEEDADLKLYIDTIKERERVTAAAIANQKLKVQEAINTQLDGENDRIAAKNQSIREKEQQEIDASRRLSVAKYQARQEIVEREKLANLAIIDKKKQLQEAKADEGIKKAQARASKYEGDRILATGLAQAKVDKAKYEAIDKEVLRIRVEETIKIAQAEAIKVVGIQMPDNVFITGNKGGTTLDALSSTMLIDKLGNVSK